MSTRLMEIETPDANGEIRVLGPWANSPAISRVGGAAIVDRIEIETLRHYALGAAVHDRAPAALLLPAERSTSAKASAPPEPGC